MEFLIIWLISAVICVVGFWWVLWGTAELKGMDWMQLMWYHFLCLIPVYNTIILLFVCGVSVFEWLDKKLRGKPFAHKDWRK